MQNNLSSLLSVFYSCNSYYIQSLYGLKTCAHGPGIACNCLDQNTDQNTISKELNSELNSF